MIFEKSGLQGRVKELSKENHDLKALLSQLKTKHAKKESEWISQLEEVESDSKLIRDRHLEQQEILNDYDAQCRGMIALAETMNEYPTNLPQSTHPHPFLATLSLVQKIYTALKHSMVHQSQKLNESAQKEQSLMKELKNQATLIETLSKEKHGLSMKMEEMRQTKHQLLNQLDAIEQQKNAIQEREKLLKGKLNKIVKVFSIQMEAM